MPRNSSLPCLQVGHLNVYHLVNKIPDVTVMLTNSLTITHVLGLSETRLHDHMYINVKGLLLHRKNSTTQRVGVIILKMYLSC